MEKMSQRRLRLVAGGCRWRAAGFEILGSKIFEMTHNQMTDFYIGLSLAFASSLFIGFSFILKKKALLKTAANNHRRAGQGGHYYLREWLWWTGVLIMASGEACNFAAFAFAPASLVTSLGAMSVLVTCILSSRFLNEKLGFLGKIGCALCILGATMIVLHAPRDGNVHSMTELGQKMQDYGFITYVIVVLSTVAFFILYLAPRYGRSNIFVFIAICSMIGSLTVLGCKGLGLAMKEQFGGDDGGSFVGLLKNPLAWLCLFIVVFCISLQLNYLNKALDVYNISMVTSIYYVGFTSCVILASGILYKEWNLLSGKDILGSLCGFLTTIIGVFQMQSFNHLNISMAQLRKLLYKPSGDASITPTTIFDLDSDGKNELKRTHRRRRSLIESGIKAEFSRSEPLFVGNHSTTNGAIIDISDKAGSRFDNNCLIPVQSTDSGDENRAVSI